MYEFHFHLSRRPFAAAPQIDLYYQAEHFEQARQSVVRAVDREEGPSLIIGPAGTGKTLLCTMVGDQLQDRFQVVTLASGRLCTRRALLQNILFGLQMSYRHMDEGELRLSLADHLEPRDEFDRGLLLIVDEAHTLPYRLLEEIRILSNHIHAGRPRVSLVLAGSSALEEHFAHPKLASFNQRVAVRTYLHSLNRAETHAYVRHQLSCCEREDEIFTAAALEAIYTATDGIPRLINQLCDHALLMASLGGHDQIDQMGIQEAWADLQQLPAPWGGEETAAISSSSSSVVEFGELDEFASSPQESEASAVEAAPQENDPTGTYEEGSVTLMMSNADRQLEELSRATMPFSMAESSVKEPAEDDARAADLPVSALAGPPEVELFFHEAHDPFGETFEEEEVVIDHYASLDTPGAFVKKVVRCEESESIRQKLDPTPVKTDRATAIPTPATIDELARAQFAGETESTAAQIGAAASALSGQQPDLPDAASSIDMEITPAASIGKEAERSARSEPAARQPNPAPRLAGATSADKFEPALDPVLPVPASSEQESSNAGPQDDRDLLVVEQETPATDKPASVRRSNYRQLFAKLRQQ